jgi:hypothetical protein
MGISNGTFDDKLAPFFKQGSAPARPVVPMYLSTNQPDDLAGGVFPFIHPISGLVFPKRFEGTLQILATRINFFMYAVLLLFLV